MTESNHYEILECSPSASYDELKQAYRKKALALHPDKNSNTSNCNDAFGRIGEAWRVLGNADLRKAYDSKLRESEIEESRATIYAQVVASDLEETDDPDLLSYPCRCGNKYLIYREDTLEPNCVLRIPCEDCTFNIVLET